MNEKILVSSQSYDIKKGVGIFLLILAVIGLVISLGIIGDELDLRTYWHEKYCYDYDGSLDCDCYGGSPLAETIRYFFGFQGTIIWGIYAGCALICGLVYLWLKSYEITVTDKRVYGKVAFGKRVDLPNDSISAIATVSLFKGIAVSTSSGRISFLLLKNASEIYDVLNRLIIDRQEHREKVSAGAPPQGGAAELKQYKELLDSGVISQEEFDAKKKQLLGL